MLQTRTPDAPLRRRALRGFTLAEMLIVTSLLALFARMLVPNLASQDDQRLEVASTEVRDALRFARAEALRRGSATLVDAETSPGKIRILRLSLGSCSSYSSTATVTDPRTKSDFVLDVSGGAFSKGADLTPRFLASGTAYGGLVFNSDGVPSSVCAVASKSSKGAPEAGSSVVVSLGNRQVSVAIDVATGRVTSP